MGITRMPVPASTWKFIMASTGESTLLTLATAKMCTSLAWNLPLLSLSVGIREHLQTVQHFFVESVGMDDQELRCARTGTSAGRRKGTR